MPLDYRPRSVVAVDDRLPSGDRRPVVGRRIADGRSKYNSTMSRLDGTATSNSTSTSTSTVSSTADRLREPDWSSWHIESWGWSPEDRSRQTRLSRGGDGRRCGGQTTGPFGRYLLHRRQVAGRRDRGCKNCQTSQSAEIQAKRLRSDEDEHDDNFRQHDNFPSVETELLTGVEFHPSWSNGTAGIRGRIRLNDGSAHFWQVNIGDRIFGTSMMVGIGTGKTAVHAESFVNLVGSDDQSWGLSHRGLLWHNNQVSSPPDRNDRNAADVHTDGDRDRPSDDDSSTLDNLTGADRRRRYTRPFAENIATTVGVMHDRGRLTYFQDGRCLGLAFDGIEEQLRQIGRRNESENGHIDTDFPIIPSLYPMVSSTAAKTRMSIGLTLRPFRTLAERCRAVIARTTVNATIRSDADTSEQIDATVTTVADNGDYIMDVDMHTPPPSTHPSDDVDFASLATTIDRWICRPTAESKSVDGGCQIRLPQHLYNGVVNAIDDFLSVARYVSNNR